MRLDYRFHPDAASELEDGVDRWLDRDLPAAVGLVEAAAGAIDVARDFSEAGARYLFGTRSLMLGRYPFRLVYRAGEVIEVIAVAHTSRSTGYWRDRLK
jgi:plasmid stabilization system protein ParE